MFNFRNFLRKLDFSGKKNLDIFEKWINFQILRIALNIYNSVPSKGLPPRTPCGGRDSLKLAMSYRRKIPGDTLDMPKSLKMKTWIATIGSKLILHCFSLMNIYYFNQSSKNAYPNSFQRKPPVLDISSVISVYICIM